MGTYSNNPIIEGRYDAYGRKTYWANGFRGQGVKVAVIDNFNEPHGHQMASVKDYIAPDCELVKLEMYGHAQGIRDALYEAVKQNVNIVSISRSTDNDTMDLHDAVKACKNAGILVFCSAGNSGDEYQDYIDIKRYPAAYDETVSVLCINNNFTPSSMSSHGSTGWITGFGQNVLVKNADGSEQLVSGTSPTTAACAFTAALNWCKILQTTGKHPLYTEMVDHIKKSTVDLGVIGKDNMTGYGFYTLDKSEFTRVKIMILDSNKNGLEDRVDQIKAIIASGVPYNDAERQVDSMYHIIGYETINGVNVPIYGGRK